MEICEKNKQKNNNKKLIDIKFIKENKKKIYIITYLE